MKEGLTWCNGAEQLEQLLCWLLLRRPPGVVSRPARQLSWREAGYCVSPQGRWLKATHIIPRFMLAYKFLAYLVMLRPRMRYVSFRPPSWTNA